MLRYYLETVLLKAVLVLFVVFMANGRKSKKRLPEPVDNSEFFGADVFCKKLSRLIRMEKADEIIVVDSHINSSILLECKHCEEKDNGLPKTWSRQKHIFTGNITEVETDMSNNQSSSSLFISKSHSLVFRTLKDSDIGLYFCKAPYIDSPEKSFNYLVDLSAKPGEQLQGSLPDLKNYTNFYLSTVNKKLSNKTFVVNHLAVKAQVFSDWDDWSECDSCFRKQGIKSRLGRCRVKPICLDSKECEEARNKLKGFVFSDKQNSEQVMAKDLTLAEEGQHFEGQQGTVEGVRGRGRRRNQMLDDIKKNQTEVPGEVTDVDTVKSDVMEFGIALSCRSILLHLLTPELYNITSVVPDFMLTDTCSAPCKGRTYKSGPRYRKSIILAKGAHLTLICPDSTVDSQIRWEHNKLRIHPNEGTDYIPGSNEPRQYVDSFNTLYLVEVTDKESGNYTCFVDGVWMQEVKIIVLTRSLFFTKEFTRHLKYLGFVFLICFFAYLGGVIITCIKRHREQVKRTKKSKKAHQDHERLLNEDYTESDSY